MPKRQTPMPVPAPPMPANVPQPIGVPDDYLAPLPASSPADSPALVGAGLGGLISSGGGPAIVRPEFFEGDEYSFVYGMTPAQLAALQAQLTSVGLLDPDSYSPGFVGGGNDPTLAAVQVVMSYANRAGYRTVADALRAYEAGGYGAVGSQGYQGAAGERLAAPVSNADDLREVFRAAVIEKLGTGWSEAQINALVEDYQAHERAYNSQVAAGETAPEEQLPSAETFAMNAAKSADPVAAQGQEFLGAANALTGMLGRWAG
jgi:hypothetical protein